MTTAFIHQFRGTSVGVMACQNMISAPTKPHPFQRIRWRPASVAPRAAGLMDRP